MIPLRRALLMLLLAEVAVGGVLAAQRLLDPAPPLPDLSDLDSLTRRDLLAIQRNTVHGGAAEWRILGQAYLGQGYYAEAEQCLRVACRLAPDDQESVYGLGFCLERMGRMQEAISFLQQAAAMSDDDLSRTCWYQIGRCHLRLEDWEEAERVFRSVAGLPPAAYQLSKLLIRTGRAADAIPILQEQLASRPDSHKLLQLRAQAAELVGDEAQARRIRDQEQRAEAGLSLEYGMSFIGMYRAGYGLDGRLSTCTRLQSTGSLPQQDACLRSALKVIRDEDLHQFDAVYLAAAETAMRLQQPDRALALLDELRELEYEDAAALELRGDAYWLRGDPQPARRSWERSLMLLPSARIHAKLAEYSREQADTSAAAAHLAASYQLNGMRAYHEGRVREARTQFRLAADSAPNDARNWYYLGETHRLRGERDEARSAYGRCLELDPDYQRARVAQSLLDRAPE